MVNQVVGECCVDQLPRRDRFYRPVAAAGRFPRPLSELCRHYVVLPKLEPAAGIEPATYSLPRNCTAIVLDGLAERGRIERLTLGVTTV